MAYGFYNREENGAKQWTQKEIRGIQTGIFAANIGRASKLWVLHVGYVTERWGLLIITPHLILTTLYRS